MRIHKSLYDVIFQRIPYTTSVKFRKDGDFFLGVGASKGDILSLNALAGKIYLFCDGDKTVGCIYNELKNQYNETDENDIAYDLCRCISDLDRKGMIAFVT